MLIAVRLCIVVASVTIAADSSFEGSKAGDARELTPGMAFRWCPAGTFMMGPGTTLVAFEKDSDKVSVTLGKGFWLGETEVTQGQWSKCMGTVPWKGAYVSEGVECPVVAVSYLDAALFCLKLTSEERNAGRLPKGWKYSLPTEAQWEYGCRADSKTHFSFGDSESQLGEFGWWGARVGGKNAKSEHSAHAVGQKKANAWGLKDMHGNVWEWCLDSYGSKLPGGRDPVGADRLSFRVIRGGAWGNDAAGCRSSVRGSLSAENCGRDIGFRVAAVLE